MENKASTALVHLKKEKERLQTALHRKSMKDVPRVTVAEPILDLRNEINVLKEKLKKERD